jgi:hypothetical protein
VAIGPRLAGPRKVPLDLRHGAWRLQPVIDALDFLAIVAERRRGAVSDPAAELMGSTAVVATALGSLSAAAEAQ